MNLSQYRYLLPEYRLGLVVIVVGYKVFHCVMWEKGLEFASKLGCQGLIVSNDQGRPLYLLDHLGNGKSLASTRCPQKDLRIHSFFHPFGEGLNGLRLITGRCKGGLPIESP